MTGMRPDRAVSEPSRQRGEQARPRQPRWMARALLAVGAAAALVVASDGPVMAKPGGATTATTTTTVTCSPNPLTVSSSEQAQCTATVKSRTGVPTGDVSFGIADSTSSTGRFDPSSCTLANGSCSVAFVPSAPGQRTISASYAGDGTFPPSVGATTEKVIYRTTTSLACTLDAGSTSMFTCRASIGPGSAYGGPDGSVTWATSGSGTFSAASSPCSQGSCTVTYTAPATNETATISGTFTPSSPYYTSSSGSTVVRSGGKPAALLKAPLLAPGAFFDWCSIYHVNPNCYDFLHIDTAEYVCAARLTDQADGAALVGEPITFAGACNGIALTDSAGLAWVSETAITGCYSTLPCLRRAFTVSFAGNDRYAPAAA